MQPIAFNDRSPQAFILSSNRESRFNQVEDEQLWNLNLDRSSFAPFHLHTTYNLRAKQMRLFPNIIINHHRFIKEEDFIQPPTVTGYAPGALQIEYCLSVDLTIKFACFLTGSDILVGSISLDNKSTSRIDLSCELSAVLSPIGKGKPIRSEKFKNHAILTGQCDDLFPVLWLSAGPTGIDSPFPALTSHVSLKPRRSAQLFWALVSNNSYQTSLSTARELASPAWVRSFQTQFKENESKVVKISTGKPEWDQAFYLAQVNAQTCLSSACHHGGGNSDPTKQKPEGTLIDRFKSKRHLSLLDLLHLSQVILPAQIENFTHTLKGFISRVDEKGHIMLSPHSFLKHKQINEAPLLAVLSQKSYQVTQDTDFLRQSFSALRRFFDVGWMSPKGQAHPSQVWQSPTQLQLGTGLFNFDTESDIGKGIDIRTAESPALASMLYREALALKAIAQILQDSTAEAYYKKVSSAIKKDIQHLWQSERKIFNYRDVHSRAAPNLDLSLQGQIQQNRLINQSFSEPQRLQIHLESKGECSRHCKIMVKGRNDLDEMISEEFLSQDFRWVNGKTHLTTKNIYQSLSTLAFEGFNTGDYFLIETADYTQEDISCLLPLWAGGIKKSQSNALIKKHLDWKDPRLISGIPEIWQSGEPLPEGIGPQINILWNTLLIEGLALAGFINQAAEGFSRLMETSVKILKDFHGFFASYDAHQGIPQGHTNSPAGYTPIDLCLQIAGIKIFTPNRVAIWGVNPFGWPIEIRWQGLWIYKEGTKTTIIFPNGSQYRGDEVKPQIIHSS